MTDVPLKDHIEIQLKMLHDAVEKAEDQLNTRLGAMNEFRESLRDQTANMVTRSEYDYRHGVVEAKIRDLELTRANFEGKAAVVAAGTSVVTSVVVGVLIFIVTHYLLKP